MQLKVIKSDGSVEEYLHTKVIGTFSNALCLIDDANIFRAEQFAEAITFYIYEKKDGVTISSAQIHSMVQSVLTDTGFENASQALNDYRLQRRLKRSRIEVVDDENRKFSPDRQVFQWDKSQIVGDLMSKGGLSRQLSRAIGSTVEEKVLKLDMTKIRRSLIKEFVAADTEAMLQAEVELQAAE